MRPIDQQRLPYKCLKQKTNPRFRGLCVVPRGGIEPPRCHHRRILSPLRLPIPPSRLRPNIPEPEELRIIADSLTADKLLLTTSAANFVRQYPRHQFSPAHRRMLNLPTLLTLDDFDFALPGELIAQHPTSERSASRLLQVADGGLHNRRFSALPELLASGDLLVFNDTRVIRARLLGRKESGGQIEVLIERIVDARHAVAQIRASKSPQAGSRIVLEDALELIVGGRSGEQGEFFELQLADQVAPGDLWTLLERHGRLPLPPYITHPAEAADEARYQTVFARHPGAVAAPTAGLHFDDALLAQVAQRGVEVAWLTLHVGAGTFQPVRVHRLAEHRMHAERFAIPPATIAAIARTRARGGKVIAVGTTSLRALESAALIDGSVRPGPAETATPEGPPSRQPDPAPPVETPTPEDPRIVKTPPPSPPPTEAPGGVSPIVPPTETPTPTPTPTGTPTGTPTVMGLRN